MLDNETVKAVKEALGDKLPTVTEEDGDLFINGVLRATYTVSAENRTHHALEHLAIAFHVQEKDEAEADLTRRRDEAVAELSERAGMHRTYKYSEVGALERATVDALLEARTKDTSPIKHSDRVRISDDARYTTSGGTSYSVSSNNRGKTGTVVQGPDQYGDFKVQIGGPYEYAWSHEQYLARV